MNTPRTVTAALLFAVIFSMGLGLVVGHQSTEANTCPPAVVTGPVTPP